MSFAIHDNVFKLEKLLKLSEGNSFTYNAANIYFLKVSNQNTRKKCEICSKLTKRKHKKDVIDVVLVFLLLTFNIFHGFYQ